MKRRNDRMTNRGGFALILMIALLLLFIPGVLILQQWVQKHLRQNMQISDRVKWYFISQSAVALAHKTPGMLPAVWTVGTTQTLTLTLDPQTTVTLTIECK